MVLRVTQVSDRRHYGRGDVAQPLDDVARLIEPAHMGVAGGEKAVRLRPTRILLDSEEQFRPRLIKAPARRASGCARAR